MTWGLQKRYLCRRYARGARALLFTIARRTVATLFHVRRQTYPRTQSVQPPVRHESGVGCAACRVNNTDGKISLEGQQSVGGRVCGGHVVSVKELDA